MVLNNQFMADNSALISRIYDAALDPAQWANVLKSIARITRSKSSVLLNGNGELQSVGQYASFNVADEWVDAYNQNYYRLDPSIEILVSNSGRVLLDHITRPDRESLTGSRKTFYQECMLPQEDYHTIGCGLSLDNELHDAIVLQRTQRQGSYQERDVWALHMLKDHVCRALRLYRGMRLADNIRHSMEALIDRLQSGVVIADHKGNPIFFNKEAERLAKQTGAFHINSCCVRASFKDEDMALGNMVKESARVCSLSSQQAGGNINLRNKQGKPIVNVAVVPLNPEHCEQVLEQQHGTVALLITSLDLGSNPLDHVLNLYNLTRAEKRLCEKLVSGLTLNEAAETLFVSKNTLRSQLRSIFAKTGTNRQTELIQFLMRLTT